MILDTSRVSFFGCFACGFARFATRSKSAAEAERAPPSGSSPRWRDNKGVRLTRVRLAGALAVKYFPRPTLRQRASSYCPWRGLGNVIQRRIETGGIYQRWGSARRGLTANPTAGGTWQPPDGTSDSRSPSDKVLMEAETVAARRTPCCDTQWQRDGWSVFDPGGHMFNFMNSRMGIFILCICGYNTKAAICFSSYFYSVRNGGHAEKNIISWLYISLHCP